MKKRWSFLLGASVLTGIASSFLLKQTKDKQDSYLSAADLIKIFQGQWWFVDKRKSTQHQLIIDEELTIKIDDRAVEYTLIEWTTKRLVVQDSFGFHLIIETKDNVPHTLYDEADDSTYLLEKIVPMTDILKED